MRQARQRRSPEELAAMQSEALDRATTGQSLANYPAIYEGFMARGIPETDINPRVNVFTYHAWQAKGRQVRRGEKGVHIVTFIVVEDKQDPTRVNKFARNSVVFHVSQTDEAKPRGDKPTYWENGTPRPMHDVRDYVRDPGEDAADRWTESHGADR